MYDRQLPDIALAGLRNASIVADEDRKARSREVAMRFGENLHRVRNRLGMSQEELAVRASLHRTEIGMLEHGQRVARIDTLIQLAGAMSIPADELIAGISWDPGGVLGGTFGFEDRSHRRSKND
ncbi:MAG TPA: helix-turn-helix transcriptional regulator [Solirubrobacterales bacterium]|nr:helix-turn-helix transcriptional regulator [Solirubrobacterales bacterium]